MFFAWLTLLVGLSISATSGYFSIIGLAHLFSASFWSVVVMGTVIEIGKIMSATWLHRNWDNVDVSKFHKAYLLLAIIISMSITSLGTFGFLSKAHLDQQQPVIEQLTAVTTIQKQLDSLQSDLSNLQKNLDNINNLSKDKNNSSLDSQRSRILKQMDKDRLQIDQLNKDLLKNKKETSQLTLELGPAKYLADIIFGDGVQNADKAVQIFIILIITIFDPLALMLILSANISFRQLSNRKDNVVAVSTKIEETPIIDVENQNVKNEEIKKEKPKPMIRNWISG